jgi:hypothetical protein
VRIHFKDTTNKKFVSDTNLAIERVICIAIIAMIISVTHI